MSEAKDLLIAKLDDYSTQNKNNYIAEGEITVTITLNEYRELIKAAEQRDKYSSRVYTLEKELDILQKDQDVLREKYNALHKEYEFLRSQHQLPIGEGVQNNV